MLERSTHEERVRLVEKFLAEGYAPKGTRGRGKQTAMSRAAKELGMSRSGFTESVARGEALFDHKVDWNVYVAEEEPEQPEAQKTRTVGENVRLRRVLDENAQMKQQLKAMEKEMVDFLDLRSLAFDLARTRFDKPKWLFERDSRPLSVEAPVLFNSDIQFGEVVLPEEVDFHNTYNISVAKERQRRLTRAAIEIQDKHMRSQAPGIVLMYGGDDFSGRIHEELARTDELEPNECLKILTQEKIHQIEHLRDAFGRVHVVAVPGNHGRQTFKPQSKRMSANNFDDLCNWAVEMYFKATRDDRVTFYMPRSGDAYFKIFNTNFVLTHGDRIGARGGQGYAGPLLPILKGAHKIRAQYAAFNKPVDYICMGHFHTSSAPPGTLVNGSVAGFTEYARDCRFVPEVAKQWMFWVHPQWGMTARREIYLEAPRPGEDMNEDVWLTMPTRG